MAMKAKQDWGTSMIQMRDAKGRPVLYDMKSDQLRNMDLETTTDEFSSEFTTTSKEDSTSTDESDSSIEVMGLTCNNLNKVNSPKLQSQVEDVKRFQLPLWQEVDRGESKVVLTTAWQVTLGEMLKQRDALVVY